MRELGGHESATGGRVDGGDDLETSRRELALLLQLTEATSGAEHVGDLFDPALDAMLGVLECDRAALMVMGDDGALRCAARRGLQEACAEMAALATLWLTEDGDPQPLLVDDIERSELLPDPVRERLRAESVCALGLAPLVHQGRLLGAILFAAGLPRRFGRHDEQLATTIACHVAQALARARLFDAERAAHAATEMAVRAREDILAVVSHDLRNPLGAVLMTAEGLLSFDDISEQIRPKVERIKRAAERMARLIDDLVDFGSIQAGRLTIDARSWDPLELIAGAVEMLSAAAEERGVDLVAEVPAGTPRICCDRERTVQVLSNLLANAIKVTPRGGRVALSATARGAEVELAVTDTGPGIDPGELPHVFERYWRSRNASYRGSGLGLTIASALVRAQGGRIGADSCLGAGSRFHFTLPAAR